MNVLGFSIQLLVLSLLAAVTTPIAGCASSKKSTDFKTEEPPPFGIQHDEALRLATEHARSEIADFAKYEVENAVYKDGCWYVGFQDPADLWFGWPGTFVVVIRSDRTAEIVRVDY